MPGSSSPVPAEEFGLAWSPDGTRLAFAANRRRDPDLGQRSGLYAVDVASGEVRTIAGGGDAVFTNPVWTRDGSALVALGERFPRAGYRTGIWRFAADGSDAGAGGGTDLLAGSELKPDAAMNSDVTPGEGPHLAISGDDEHVLFAAPIEGSNELWRVPLAGGEPERLTHGEHYLSGWDALPGPDGTDTVVAVRSAPTVLPELVRLRVPGRRRGAHRRSPRSTTPWRRSSRWSSRSTATGRATAATIQGWLYPSGPGRQPLVLQIHGGPHTLYGWSPMLEWQILASTGVSVLGDEPARLRGLRRGVQPGQPGRLGRRPDGGRDRGRGPGDRRRARRSRPAGRHGRLVRRLPHELDRGPDRPLPGGADVPLRRRHAAAVPHRRHLAAASGPAPSSGATRGRTRPTSTRSHRSTARPTSAPRC